MPPTYEAVVDLTTKYLKLDHKQIVQWLNEHAGHDPRTSDACMQFAMNNASIDKGSDD